jgi:DUF4097 and DUF4098 domain-containing protein YvlB
MFSLNNAARALPLRSASILVMALALCFVHAMPALATRTIDETHRAAKDADISIETIEGSVTVTGWNRNEVKITGTLSDRVEELEVTGDDKQLTIKIHHNKSVTSVREGSQLQIQVPVGSRLEIATVSAEISVDQTEGALEVMTVSGGIVVRGQPATVRAKTVSGRIDVDASADRVSLSCISGTITVAGVRQHLTCKAVSGDVQIQAGKELSMLTCEAVSGNITIEGPIERQAEWDLSTHSGNVTVDLSGKVDARFQLKTFSGRIHDVFGHQAERTSKYAPGRELNFTEGGGGALIVVNVFSGNIMVRNE